MRAMKSRFWVLGRVGFWADWGQLIPDIYAVGGRGVWDRVWWRFFRYRCASRDLSSGYTHAFFTGYRWPRS